MTAVFVELSDVADQASVADSVASAVGLRAIAGDDLLDAVADALAGEPLPLLVVDNAEHLVPVAAAATCRVNGDPEPEFAGAYLVDRRSAWRFTTRVDALRAWHPQLDIALTGPWPPFSFTESTDG